MTASVTEKRTHTASYAAVFAMALCLQTAAAQKMTPGSEIMQQAEMIFIGAVERSGAAATADIEATEKTAVVRVDRIVTPGDWSPLRSFQGQRVTVQLNDPASLPAGSTAIFYTKLWRLGQGLALTELTHTRIEIDSSRRDAAISDASAQVSRAVQAEADRTLQGRLERAALVVSGEVSSVRKLESAERSGQPGRLSEHDPEWREAVIEVRQVMKGPAMGGNAQVAVRFPGSRDVMWAGSPKFEVGQEGIFILSASEVTSIPQPRQPVDFTGVITDPADYLPGREEQRLRDLMRR